MKKFLDKIKEEVVGWITDLGEFLMDLIIFILKHAMILSLIYTAMIILKGCGK